MVESRYEDREFLIPANGVTSVIGLPGKYIYCLAATNEFLISIDGAPFQPMRKNMEIEVEEFGQIQLKDTSGSPLTVRLIVSNGKVKLNELTVSNTLNSVVESGTTFAGNTNASIGTSAALLIAADSTRKHAIIQNKHASNFLYIGNSGVTTSNGLEIAPNGVLTLETTAAIYAIASGASTDVRHASIKE